MQKLETLVGKMGPEGAYKYLCTKNGQTYLKRQSYGSNFFHNGRLDEKMLRNTLYGEISVA